MSQEHSPEQTTPENKIIYNEATIEHPPHLDVASLMKEKNAFFVHMIQVTDAVDVSENNDSLDTNKLSVANKLDLLYGMNPTLSASTLRPKTNDGTFHGAFGVVFSQGEIESATRGDTGTKAKSLTKRNVGTVYKSPEDIDNAIDRQHIGDDKSYNEIVLKNPEVCAGFMKLGSMESRTTYEEVEHSYFDKEKTVTRIGVVDFTNPVDRFGRQMGSGYDKPFSVLLEMIKRGKTMFMDEANQMYIIRDINEKTRKVEFIAAPITPVQLSESYGKEKMNKYLKQEMTERLENSLEEKVMTLQ